MCELCFQPFHFAAIYKPDTPDRLTLLQFSKGVWAKIEHIVPRVSMACADYDTVYIR